MTDPALAVLLGEPPLAVLLVFLPILAAAVLLPLRRRLPGGGWSLAFGTLLGQTALAAVTARTVVDTGPVRYTVGGLPATVGIELVVDRLAVPFVLLVAVVSLGTLAYTRREGPRSPLFFSLVLLLVAGLTGIFVTGDVFNLYVFLEISGLSAYALVATGDGRGAGVAAFDYLLLGTVGASLYLLGVGYAYVATGTLNMATLADRFAALGHSSTLVLVAFALMFVGLGIKIPLVPLHAWLPDAHSTAPTGVSVLLSGLVTTAASYALLRLLLSVYTVGFLAANPFLDDVVLGFAAASVVVGSLFAFRQSRVKRMLAYSTVSQLGLVVIGIGLATETAVTGVVIHLLGHAVMKGGLFLAAGVIATSAGATAVEEYADLGRRAPVASAAFAVAALGTVGVPPLAGFVGKWYIARGAVEAGHWPVVAVVLASTLLSLAYFGRVVQRLYFHPPPPAPPAPTEAVPPGTLVPPLGAAVLTAVFAAGATAFARYLEPVVSALV